MQAVGQNILVKLIKEDRSEGGIILPPDTKTDGAWRGSVLSVGPEVPTYQVGSNLSTAHYPRISVGDTIWFGEFGVNDLGDDVLAVSYDSVLAREAPKRDGVPVQSVSCAFRSDAV